jgi:hypothetical protein
VARGADRHDVQSRWQGGEWPGCFPSGRQDAFRDQSAVEVEQAGRAARFEARNEQAVGGRVGPDPHGLACGSDASVAVTFTNQKSAVPGENSGHSICGTKGSNASTAQGFPASSVQTNDTGAVPPVTTASMSPPSQVTSTSRSHGKQAGSGTGSNSMTAAPSAARPSNRGHAAG